EIAEHRVEVVLGVPRHHGARERPHGGCGGPERKDGQRGEQRLAPAPGRSFRGRVHEWTGTFNRRRGGGFAAGGTGAGLPRASRSWLSARERRYRGGQGLRGPSPPLHSTFPHCL